MSSISIVSRSRCGRLNPDSKDTVWIYAGTDCLFYWKVSNGVFRNVKCAIEPGDFQTFVTRQRADFVRWSNRHVSAFSAQNWLSDPFDRNPENNLFLYFCWLAWIQEWLANHSSRLIVVVDDCAMAAAVARLSRRNQIDLVTDYGDLVFDCVKRLMRVLAVSGFRLVEWIYRSVLAKTILRAPTLSSKPAILITTYFLGNGCIDSNGVFRDRYLPGLLELYERNGFDVIVAPTFYDIPLKHFPRIYTFMARSKTKFIVAEQFVPVRGQIAALLSWLALVWRTLIPGGPSRFIRNEDLYGTVRDLALRNTLIAFPFLVSGQVPRFAAKRGMKLEAMIQWYENQPKDKYVLLNFRRCYPNAISIAAQSYCICGNYLSLPITREERAAGIAPDQIWIPGAATMKIHAAYDGEAISKYRPMPALRYQQIFETARKRQHQNSGGKFTMTILLPHSVPDSIYMLWCAAAAITHVQEHGGEVRIKTHPIVTMHDIQQSANSNGVRLDGAMKWVDLPVEQLLVDTDLVLTGGSSAALEAVACGVPALVVGFVAGLDLNPLEAADKRLWSLVYDQEQAVRAVQRWMSADAMPSKERLEVAREILKTHFVELRNEDEKLFCRMLGNHAMTDAGSSSVNLVHAAN